MTVGPRTPLLPPLYLPPVMSLVGSMPGPTPAEIAAMQTGRDAGAGPSWVLGGEFRSIACTGEGTVFDPCSVAFLAGDLAGLVKVTPFGVVVADRCSTFGFAEAEYVERALLKYQVQHSYFIAREFWTGSLNESVANPDGFDPPNFSLTNNAAWSGADDITPAVVPKPQDALGRLDEAINQCLKGAMGAIHLTISMLHDAAVANGVRFVGDALTGLRAFTYAGTPLIADAGYPGTAPDGSDPGDEVQWMYATAMPKLYSTEPTTYPDTLRQATSRDGDNSRGLPPNTVEFRAIGAAAVAVDPCCLIGIRATRAGTN